MIRVLVPQGTLVAGADLPLAPEESHHLQVRRVGDASAVVALDAHGASARGRVRRDGRDWIFQVDELLPTAPATPTILAVGAGDRDRFIQLAEQATELGVSRIIPLDTERSRQVATRLRVGSIDKVRRAAAEACKQCGNPWAPMVVHPMPLEEFLTARLGGRWFLADPAGGPAPVLGATEPVGWLIGPEGGFTNDELRLIDETMAPAHASLGAHVLRFETAATAAAAVTAGRRARD